MTTKKRIGIAAAAVLLVACVAIAVFWLVGRTPKYTYTAVVVDTEIAFAVQVTESSTGETGLFYVGLAGAAIEDEEGNPIEAGQLQAGQLLSLTEYREDPMRTAIYPPTIDAHSVKVVGEGGEEDFQQGFAAFAELYTRPIVMFYVEGGALQSREEEMVATPQRLFAAWRAANGVPTGTLVERRRTDNGHEDSIGFGNSAVVSYTVGDEVELALRVDEVTAANLAADELLCEALARTFASDEPATATVTVVLEGPGGAELYRGVFEPEEIVPVG